MQTAEAGWRAQFEGQRPPFEPGNRLAETHGFYAAKLRPNELDEVQDIASTLRDLSPASGDALEPLLQITAAKVWRWRRLHGWLAANADRMVGSDGRLADVIEAVDRFESRMVAALDKLALTPEAVADLGLTHARTVRLKSYDLDALPAEQRHRVRELVAACEQATAGGVEHSATVDRATREETEADTAAAVPFLSPIS